MSRSRVTNWRQTRVYQRALAEASKLFPHVDESGHCLFCGCNDCDCSGRNQNRWDREDYAEDKLSVRWYELPHHLGDFSFDFRPLEQLTRAELDVVNESKLQRCLQSGKHRTACIDEIYDLPF